MLQLSKVKKSRDEWKKKAKKKTKELWEMRKVLKYYRNRVANLIGENKRLRAELKELKEKEIKSNILPQKSRQFKKKSNSIQNSLSHALILTKST